MILSRIIQATARMAALIDPRHRAPAMRLDKPEQVRCPFCNHRLFDVQDLRGSIETKCPNSKCDQIVRFTYL